MADQSTYIKLDRNIMRWRWWKKEHVLHVFLFLLLSANVENHEFENDEILRGQVATSYGNISRSTGLTIREIRTAISTLKKTGEVTSRSTNRYQVITIVNYDRYQENRQTKRQANGHPSDRQVTPKRQQYKNIKNDKNEKNNKGRSAPTPTFVGTYPCGLAEKPDWMDDRMWESARLMTADDIPGLYRGEYDSIIDYLHDKQEGKL